MKRNAFLKLLVMVPALVLAGALARQSPRVAQTPAKSGIDRTVLPVPEPPVTTITTLDARDAKAPPRFEVKAPKGAPNVVIVLLDDIGFGQSSAFGGPVKMATLDLLAAEGLRYNNFHTTALCSLVRGPFQTNTQASS